MKDWLAIAELAAAKLPGLPFSKHGVRIYAERHGWVGAVSDDGMALSRRKDGKGGGHEFHISLLPQVALTRLEAKRGRHQTPEDVARETAKLKARDVSRRDARLFVIARAEDFARTHTDLSRDQAFAAYAAAYNARTAEVPEWVRLALKGLSGRTLQRWRKFRNANELHKVAGLHGQRRGGYGIEQLLDGKVAVFIGALIVKQPFLAAPQVRALVDGKFGAELGELPSPRTFQRYVTDWKRDNALVLRKLTDPDGFKSSARLSGSNMNAHVRALNQLWEIDASPADVLTTDGRHAIYVVIDTWSRRMLVLVTKTPRTEATLALIRRAILLWGVPDAIKTDNGSDFTSQRFVAAMNSLGIAHIMTDTFAAEQKGTVERAIGTLQRGLMPLLPGFVGHSVADRKVIEQRKAFAARLGESEEDTFCVEISAAELQTICDEYAANVYGHAAHRGLNGQSPFHKAASWTGGVRRIENERALDLLLMPMGTRTATKQGISIDKGWFISPDLMPGTRYLCRQDPEDMGRLFVFEDEAGAYVTTAICPERAGIDPREAVRLARERQAELIKERAAEVRSEARKIKPRDMIGWQLEAARRKAANLTPFPHKASPHTSDALTAAADATGADDLPPVTVEAMPSLVATNVVKLPETPKQKFTRAVRLEACVAAGDPLSTEDAMWLGSYQTTAEYRSQKDMLEAFGPEAVLEKG